MKNVSALNNVPETMLIPLCLKAKETREKGIINDTKAVEIVSEIDYDFSKIEKDSRLQVSMAVRTVLFDKIVKDLAAQYPDLAIVNLGAGLDTRQERFPEIK